MRIYPAIDLYDGKAVRLTRGDYAQMTVYSDDPLAVAHGFRGAGAEFLHVVDLQGARDGTTANIETIRRLIGDSGLAVEVGGGVRTREVAERYIEAGALRVILGTAAITQDGFVAELVREFGDKIAVGVDIRDGHVAIKGWTEVSARDAMDFCRELEGVGVRTIICTDISKDGVLGGTNLALYRDMAAALGLDIIASGGVSTIADVAALAKLGLHGAILGKALYTGGIDLAEAIREVNNDN
ncbi:MAG: 1-(5-phosphoribosyl)-5-[(5-phosphoribosylamino)methylideneamino]imidazole-4-carboxamide isomerase [Oscillospiraceae bacterium]|nr:1-(5-phosphoribosyl)-5-[(5-phosphoribosylamino)methylideneamino]imidazole-4-carboxamide isomerase [Oscillospiraceae bacterium]